MSPFSCTDFNQKICEKKIPTYIGTSKKIVRFKYLAHVIEKPNLRIPNPQYFLLFK